MAIVTGPSVDAKTKKGTYNGTGEADSFSAVDYVNVGDTVPGGAANYTWTMDGLAGDDNLTGGTNKDKISGGLGNDTLDGGSGADALIGGAGDDVYIVDNLKDVVTELADTKVKGATVVGGIDTVLASVDYTLGKNLENLILTGTAIKGTGNTGANSITGNAQDNILIGGAGADILDGGIGDDTLSLDTYGDVLTGGVGTDVLDATKYVFSKAGKGQTSTGLAIDASAGTYAELILTAKTKTTAASTSPSEPVNFTDMEAFIGSAKNDVMTAADTGSAMDGGAGDDTLIGGIGSDTLIGGKGKDVLNGNDGADILSGDTGDTLKGGAGDDTIVWNTGMIVDGGEGTDVITAADSAKGVTINLQDGKTTTVNKVKVTDYYYDNVEKVIGSNYADKLTAGPTGTVLDGKAGDDVLTGGAGADIFIFNAAYGKDTIQNADSADYILLGDKLKDKNGDFALTAELVKSGKLTDLVLTTADGEKLTIKNYKNDGSSDAKFIDANGNIFDFSSLTVGSKKNEIASTGETAADLPDSLAADVAKTYEATIGEDTTIAAGNHTNDSLKINAPTDLFDYANFLATDATGISIAQDGTSLEFSFGTGQGTLTLEGYYAEGAQNITKLELPTVFGASTVLSGFKATSNLGGVTAGTAGDDFIYGLSGNDIITGGTSGHDFLYGGGGNDVITASGQSSMLAGGTGNDKLTGSGSFDVLVGGDGNDSLTGGAGRDVYVYGGNSWGDDVIVDSGTNYVAFANQTTPNEDILATVVDGHVVLTAGDSTIDLGTTDVAGDFRFVFGNPDANNSTLYKIDITGANATFATTDQTVNLHTDVFGVLF